MTMPQGDIIKKQPPSTTHLSILLQYLFIVSSCTAFSSSITSLSSRTTTTFQPSSWTRLALTTKKVVPGRVPVDNNDNQVIPFIVQKVSYSNAEEFKDISNMCIDVFFNEGAITGGRNKNGVIMPWKEAQLAYLRHAQYSDLRNRRMISNTQNEMFIARKLIATSSEELKDTSRYVDETSNIIIYNRQALPQLMTNENEFYVTDEIIGFGEVTERVFGLGGGTTNEIIEYDDIKELRPLITNLAVKSYARKSSVGSKLVEACEEVVVNEWDPPYYEMVLQVEEENEPALRFYENRGYEVLFKDPTTRRFDTTGFFLKQVRSTKVCMRKSLRSKEAVGEEKEERSGGAGNLSFGENLLQLFRKAVVLVGDKRS